ncbi:hypothetical protein ACH4OY_03535 [Micromonospora rubida]|uniref:Uncharacterized protein n=1 Tax=Micromonospora rubida TaxID=2697657 RepID=A0ABW7SDL3_9ACTN
MIETLIGPQGEHRVCHEVVGTGCRRPDVPLFRRQDYRMASKNNDQPALFFATESADGLDGPGVTFDGSEEAMRRLRHPFAVKQTRPPVGHSQEQRA